MLFNSIEFIIFFLVVTTLYFALPHKARWFLLLMASCFFYMFFKPVYILILFFTIIIDYYAGILIEQTKDKRKRKKFLALSIIANVSVLAIFKYYNFINDNATALLQTIGVHNPVPALSILLPIGLSFHTFQAMAYTIEVYRENQAAEKKFGIYALYVMFYPQLVAGPIERPQNLIYQFYEKHVFDYERVVSGLRLMLWGFFKKIVIADRFAIIADQVYNNPESYHGIPLVIGTVAFAIQIYCDFSGYSDIAIGAARVMGFTLMKNFNVPYIAASVSEFWKRWHISLSTWFKDYLYISLGGNRVPIPRLYFNLFIVFLISGLWHGANWTFVIWGGLNGTYLIGEILVNKYIFKGYMESKNRISRIFRIVITFILICISWIFFRANNLHDAMYVIKNLIPDLSQFSSLHALKASFETVKITIDDIYILSIILCIMLIYQRFENKKIIERKISELKPVFRWSLYITIILGIIFFGVFENKQFIYFQF